MEFNIYWKDLTENLRQQLIEAGFEPTEDQQEERKDVGILITNGESQ